MLFSSALWAGRFAPGCVYRGAGRGCAPFTRNLFEATTSVVWPSQRECIDVNVGVETMYIFTPITTWTTSTSTSLNITTTNYVTMTTASTITTTTTFSTTTTVTTFLHTSTFSPLTFTLTTTISGVTTMTTVVTGSVDVNVGYSTTISGALPISTETLTLYVTEPTQVPTTLTSTFFATTTYYTGALAGGLTIGTRSQDWSYLTDRCQPTVVFSGNATTPYNGGPVLLSDSIGGPLFLSSNREYDLYPCETLQLWATLNVTRDSTVSLGNGAYSTADDPAYGAGLFGAFDPVSGFSFYFIITPSKVYAMYSRVPLRCGCQASVVGAAAVPGGGVGGGCRGSPCAAEDRAIDAEFPFPEDYPYPKTITSTISSTSGSSTSSSSTSGSSTSGSSTSGSGTSSSGTSSSSSTSGSSTSTSPTTLPVPGKVITPTPKGPNTLGRLSYAELLAKGLGSGLDGAVEKFGFEYYSFTYLVPIANLDPLALDTTHQYAIDLNAGVPSVTWRVDGQSLLTIANVGSPIDSRFQIANYGGSQASPDFPTSVRLAAAVLEVSESTKSRTACQGLFNQCYLDQTIQDARYTGCIYGPPPGAFNSTVLMAFRTMAVQRIRKIPRPCCATYA